MYFFWVLLPATFLVNYLAKTGILQQPVKNKKWQLGKLQLSPDLCSSSCQVVSCCKKQDDFCVSGDGKCSLYNGFLPQLNLVFTSSHWTNPQVESRKGLQLIAWFDVLQENCKSDQLDTVQTAENMKTDVSLILLKQMLLPTYQCHLFWRVGGYFLFRQVNNIFKGCPFGRMLQLSVNWGFVCIHCKKRWASLWVSGAQKSSEWVLLCMFCLPRELKQTQRNKMHRRTWSREKMHQCVKS